MNFNAPTIIIAVVIIIAIPYVISIIKKIQNKIPFSDALNPFLSAAAQEAILLKISISPIVQEIETKRVHNFMQHWTTKFENGTLTDADVQQLNAKIEEGNKQQVDGILSLHPKARILFNTISERLKAEALAIAEAEALKKAEEAKATKAA